MHLPQRRLGRRTYVVIVALLFVLTTPASALTANDVRGWYGVALQPDVKPLLSELHDVARTARDAEVTELYNEVLLEYPVDQLNADISVYTAEVSDISSTLISGVDVPFEDLLSLEQEYYEKCDKLNSLLSVRDVVVGLTPGEHHEDLDALYESIAELEKAIQTAGHYDDIGSAGVWPAYGVNHHYNSGFGSRWDPITNDRIAYHSGVDLYAPMSTPVVATFSGMVYKTGVSMASGNYIYLDHGHGVRTFYCHLSEVLVRAGQNVTQGTKIALSGNTGTRTTGPHLHFGVYIDGQAVDPKVVLEHD